MRSLIYYLISQTMDSLLKNASLQKKYIDKFAKYIIDQAKTRNDYNYHRFDPISIISTNWDILLDKSLYSMLEPPPISGICNNKAVIDYKCHISSFEEDDNTIKPALEIMGRGGFCVKLIKLHGSLNWLQCPKCQRVYADFKEKIAILPYKDDYYCRHCETNYGNKDKSNRLTSNMVMPTFLKDFTNPQYKMIWRGAGIELSEASKLVFIGYSLPQADFELRQLLSRMVRKEAEIEVVSKGKNNDMEKRYEIFFGSRKIQFFREGAKHYIENNLK